MSWNKYPEVKPKKVGSYLCIVAGEIPHVMMFFDNWFIDNFFSDCDVDLWLEIPPFLINHKEVENEQQTKTTD